MKKAALYSVCIFLTFLLVGTLLIGFSHTPFGKPYLGSTVKKLYTLLGAAGASCPLGFDRQLSMAEREARRATLAQFEKEKPKAETRNLFGLQLQVTTRAEIESWSVTSGGRCKNLKSPYEIECEGPFEGSSISTLWLEFDGQDRLVTSRGIAKFSEASKASELFQSLQQSLKSQAKNNIKVVGNSAPQNLMAGLLNQASVVADFSNLKATVRITNMGKEVAVTHEYLAF